MKLKIRFADQIVGLFILLAFLCLAAALILLGINQRWFAKNYHFHTVLRSSSQLNVGMSIKFKGFEIGKVDSFMLDPETRFVIMNFHIYKVFYNNVVFENSVIELAISPIGIGGGLLFHPGRTDSTQAQLLEEGSFIPSLDFKEGMELVRRGLVDKVGGADDTLGALVSQVGPLVEQLRRIGYSIEELTLLIDDAFKGDRQTQLGSLVYNANALLASADRIVSGRDRGPVGNILNNVSATTDTLGASVDKITADLTALAEDLKLITGNIEEMTADPDGLATRLIDPKGSLKTFLDDGNVLYDKVEAMMESVKQIVAELETFAGFLTDSTPQITGLLEEGRAALAMSQDVMEALKNNPLLSGGVPKEAEQPSTFSGYRDEEF